MSFDKVAGAEPLPGYRLMEPLGSGGFGDVWKCEAPGGLNKAIKFVFGNLNAQDIDSARAHQEREALNFIKEVRHPFVLNTERIEVLQGEVIIVMELADKSLHDLFVECQAAGLIGIPRDDLLRYLRDASEALDHMYDKHKLQHLDIKPRNLFLISDRVKVADFGLVRNLDHQSNGLASVTPLYAPPETFAGKISEHSDQYSLAIVYQEMLIGQRPFNGKNARQLMMQHTREEPELRGLPESDRPIVERALSKDPAKRFPNCLSFVRALYMARPKTAESLLLAQPTTGKVKTRTLHETMEDMHLEQHGSDSGEAVSPSPSPSPEDQLVPVDDVSQLGITVHQPETGAIRPTLIIGIGNFGRRVLTELRCRFLDRFGDLNKLPIMRFLCIDPDPDAAKAAQKAGSPFSGSGDFFHCALQTVSNYRRRNLEQISEWLPREKLYAMPRSLQTQGHRALGRLAFADNQLKLMARIRRDVQLMTHPDSLYQAVSQTGLALRDGTPRIYVVAAAGGGGSGMLADLGYAIRRLLAQLQHTDGHVTCSVFCGAPDDPATPTQEQSNIYASLTELHHFRDDSVPFTAQYGADAPRIVDNGAPYHGMYLLRVAHRSPEMLRDAVAHLGSYLFHELTTPLGLRLDRIRDLNPTPDHTAFRSFGTYAVWFPRGLLLRLAGRRACVKLLKEWEATGEPTAFSEIDAACARALSAPELRFEAVCSKIEEMAAASFEASLAQSLGNLLASLEEQSVQSLATDDPGNWAYQAVGRVSDWIGIGLGKKNEIDLQKSRLAKALSGAIQKLAEDWDQQLAKIAFGLMEHPGKRVAAAEAALKRFTQYCNESADAQKVRRAENDPKLAQGREQLEKALEACVSGGGGFSFFGGRQRRLIRVFMDHLAAFSRQCLSKELLEAGIHFFGALRGKLEDRLREIAFCRQRLRPLQEKLAMNEGQDLESSANMAFDVELTPMFSPVPSTETYWESIRKSRTVAIVLPDAQEELEDAADQFVGRLNGEQWQHIDQSVQDRFLGPLGGLHKICLTSNDLAKGLADPLALQVAECLSEYLPITDVAQVEYSTAQSQNLDIPALVSRYLERAKPLLASKKDANQIAFLLIPASDAGRIFGEQAKEAMTELELVKVPGQADLMFCREQGFLRPEDLQPVLGPCRKAYEESVLAPATTPHSRSDITDWIPLDP